jgi:hypothetical protein
VAGPVDGDGTGGGGELGELMSERQKWRQAKLALDRQLRATADAYRREARQRRALYNELQGLFTIIIVRSSAITTVLYM